MIRPHHASRSRPLRSSAVHAQTTLTFSTWVPPTHHLTIWQANWAAEVEKATGGRVKFQSLPKAPAAPPGTFDAVRDGLVDLSYVTASYTPARHVLPLMAELPGRRRDRGDQLGRLLAASTGSTSTRSASTRASSCSAVWTHGPGQMLHQEADQQPGRLQGHEDPHRRRHLPRRSATAGRLGLRQARARVLRAAQLRRGRRRVLPVRVDRLVQARQGARARRRSSRAASTAPRSASS